jgi:hypothetical protein
LPRRPHDQGHGDVHPSELRPCYRAAFVAFEAMIERGAARPPDQTVARTAGGDVANRCATMGGRLHRRGLRRVVVRKRGYRTARQRVRVLRPRR